MSNKKDNLGDRMKGYESISRTFLTRRIPVIIRLDGKAFHTFTKGLEKPFDDALMHIMQKTTQYLCENIQGCVFGYTQSDEITLVLTDYATITTDAWFGYNVEKMVSISASMATLAFNRFWEEEIQGLMDIANTLGESYNPEDFQNSVEAWRRIDILSLKRLKAMFDSRVFSSPKEEVVNCLLWRQQDATRNSIQSVGQANFSPKQLHGKSCDMIQDMLSTEKGINWEDFPVVCKRGTGCYKRKVEKEMVNPKTGEVQIIQRSEWFIDTNIPVFSQDRGYIEKWL